MNYSCYILGVCSPTLLVECGGVSSLVHSLAYCPNAAPAMGESVLGVLLHLLNNSKTRRLLSLSPDDLSLAVEEHWSLKEILARNFDASSIRRDPLSILHSTMAPLTDFHYKFLDGSGDASANR